MGIVLAKFAIGSYCLDGISSLFGLFQFWHEQSGQSGIKHIGIFAGYSACCLASKETNIPPTAVVADFLHQQGGKTDAELKAGGK